MKLSEFKQKISSLNEVNFVLPNGNFIPKHFHVTEVGQVTKKFIDCGGVVRNELVVNFQLWEAEDIEHRLAPQKLMDIINLSEKVLGLQDAEIEVEYQGDTICKYALASNEHVFQLLAKQTDCLAADKCGIPQEKIKINLSEFKTNSGTCCTPGSNCC